MATTPKLSPEQARSAGAQMIERLRRGIKNERLCKFPGGQDGEFVLVPLLCDEVQEAYSAAQKRWDDLKLKVDILNSDDFMSEVYLQVIARAMRDPADPERKKALFSSPDELRSLITPDERTAITTMYVEVNEQANPDPDEVDPKVMDQIREIVKKKGRDATAELSVMPSKVLANYLLGTASQ